jgi:hypothetical protein
MPRPFARIALSTALALAAACVDDPDAADDDLGVDEAALGGTATTARPAIGRVHRDGTTASCAATLISPIMIVTGDGCIGGRASLAPFAGSTFHFVDASGVRRLVQVAEVAGFHGLAFGRLSPPIPASQATPLAFAVTPPRAGVQVSAFGWLAADVTQKRVQTFFDDGVEATSPITFEANDGGAPHVFGGASGASDVWGLAVLGSQPFAKHVMAYQRHLDGLFAYWHGYGTEGLDRPGMDYASFSSSPFVTTAFACEDRCRADDRCRAWAVSVSANRCFLKDGVPPARAAGDVISGLGSATVAARFDGHDLTSLTVPRLEQCQQACGGNAQCAAYTWEPTSGFCVLKGAIGPRVPCGTCVSGHVDRATAGYDRPGSDYAFDNVADRAACTKLCAEDARCLAYTFVESNRGCWRKDGVPWATATAGMASARRRGLRYNTDFPGNDYRSFTTTAADPASTCQAACARETACKAWSLSEASSSTCHLKSGIAAPATKRGVVAGLKGVEFD